MKLVRVIWEDASDLDEGPWVDRGNPPPVEVTIFHQVGYILSITPDELILTHAVSKDQTAIRSRIPIGMVRSLVELTEGEPVAIPKRKRKSAK